jgi:hypothetical protein
MTIIDHRWKSGATGNVNMQGRDLSAELWVDSDDPEDTGFAVIQYLIGQGFVYGSTYNVGNDDLSSRTPIDTYLYQIDPPELAGGSSTTWLVRLLYKMVTPAERTAGGGELATNPIQRRPKISTSTVTRTRVVDRAVYMGGLANGWEVGAERDITNSAGVPISPRMEIDRHNRVIRIERNFPAVYVSQISLPIDWINSQPVTISDRTTTITIMQHQLKFLGWATDQEFEQNQDFVRVTFEGEIQESGWLEEVLDEGREELITASDPGYITGGLNLKPVTQQGMGRVADPKPLDGNGKILPKDQPMKYAKWRPLTAIDIRSYPYFAGIAQ